MDAKAHGEKELSGYQAMAAERTRYVRKKTELLHSKIVVSLVDIQSFPNGFVRTARPAASISFSTSTIDELAGGLLQARTMLLSRMPVLSVLHNSIARHHVPTRSCHSFLNKHRFKRMKRKDIMPDKIVPCSDVLDFQLDLSIQGWI